VTEIASQAFSPVSPSQQSEPLTVVLLGLALAALIGRRRGILVRILVRSRSRSR
jgi:MYXO-CTERM domain-containing protein